MRIPFFGRKPEPFTEGQIEYLRRYNVFGEVLAYRGNRPGPPRPLPTEPGLVRPPCPPRQGEFDQQWHDYTTAFHQRKPLAPLPEPTPQPDPIDWAVGVLNSALVCDAAAIQAIMALEVPVNESLAEHPTIQVGESHARPVANEYTLRPLGLINGLFGVDSDSWGFIAMVVNADGSIDRFERLVRNGDSI